MSLKKRTEPYSTTSKKDEEEDESDGPHQRSTTSRKKRSCANAFIVISDSDGETQKQENEGQRRKNKLSIARNKLEAKRRIAQMTEEEQLELAVKMSEQEASQVNSRQETEEELLKKAIAESLNSKPSSKLTRKSKASLMVAPKALKQMSQTEEEENLNCSQTTCPDSQPLPEAHSPVSTGKSNILFGASASSVSPNKKSALAPLSGSCSRSPIRKSASQLLDRATCVSPVRKSGPQTPSGANCASPVDSQLLHGTNCATPIKKAASQLLDGHSTLSSPRKPCSQPLEEAGCSSHASKPLSESLNGTTSCESSIGMPGTHSVSETSSASPVKKSASQPLSGVSCLLSPIRKPLPQPVSEARSWSLSVGESLSQPISGSSYLSPLRKSSSQPQTEIEPSLTSRMCASNSPNEGIKSPVVLLERLSQDIVEGSSVVLSLAGSPSSSALTNNSDFVTNSPLKHQHAMSPTFPRRSQCALQLAPRRLMSNLMKSPEAVTKVGEKGPSDGVESSSGSSTPEHLLELEGNGILGKDAPHPTQSVGWGAPTRSTKCYETSKETLVSQETCPIDSGTVHYYWGVPFCPKGVDPSQYSKVILYQLEVYQKSLKQAQRQLLQKMEFGAPILPRPPSLRRRDHCRGDEKDEESQENTWAGLSPREDPLSENSRESSLSLAAEERTAPAEDGPTTSYAQSRCIVETPNGSDSHADAIEVEPMEDTPARDSALSCSGMQGKPDSAGTQEEEEVTVCPETQPSPFSDSDTERRNPTSAENSSQSPSEHDLLEEENEKLPPSTVECEPIAENRDPSVSDVEPSATDMEPAIVDVQCPLCGQEFAAEQIEHHAADCDGNAVTPEKKVAPVLTRRQRGMKRTAQDVEALLSLADTGKRKSSNETPHALHFPGLGKCEKCYLCKELVPLWEYKGHVENCLKAADLEANSPTLRSSKQNPGRGDGRLNPGRSDGRLNPGRSDGRLNPGRSDGRLNPGRSDGRLNPERSDGRLLSMLDQSESMSVAAGSKTGAPESRAQRLRPHETGEDQDQMTHILNAPSSPEDFSSPLPFSNSPIKSFVSISEATDCLVDFKKQFTREPGRGRGQAQGRSSGRRQRNRGWRGKRR